MSVNRFKVGDKIKDRSWPESHWFEIKFFDLNRAAFGINQDGFGECLLDSELDDMELYKEQPKFKEVTMYAPLFSYDYGNGVTLAQNLIIYKTKEDAINRNGSIGYAEQKVFLKDEGER